jgi:hypothetical protein
MLFDCFIYFNEKELLELRYEILKDTVDGFIIADANRTFAGDEKPFTCLDTIRELGLPEDRIQVMHVELPSKEEIYNPWIREAAQRDALSVGMRMTPEDSAFFLSDVDEIPRPEALLEAVELVRQRPEHGAHLSMPMFYGRGDLRVVEPTRNPNLSPTQWTCGTVILYEHLQHRIYDLRQDPENFVYREGKCDCGWHFSFMGGPERIRTKVISYSHYADDVPNAVAPCDSPEMMEYIANYKPVAGGCDPLGRKEHILEPYPHELLPPEMFKIERVRKFLLPDD